MKLYNTLSRQKEAFHPLHPDYVGLYSCGPTVYNAAHIGNMRSYLFMDWLRRVLRFNGFAVRHVMNVTDVGHLVSDADEGEDKMLKGAREQNRSPWDIAAEYEDLFFADLGALNIETPEIVCKATEYIDDMIAFVEGLWQCGYAYETKDGIYYDIQKFPDYGKLSGIRLEDQMAGARVERNPDKRHPADFALWIKAPKEHIMQWPSPWGQGYPGWHIECSAMSRRHLGDRFDIHTGGVDHIPVHHENEIAQSEGLLGHPSVNIWMHGEFMLVDGGKMGKSLGNAYTLADLAARGYSPMHFRYFCAGGQYSSKLNFTWDAMDAAKTSYERLCEAVRRHKNGTDKADADDIAAWREKLREAVSDDLSIPKAMGLLWSLVKRPGSVAAVYDTALEIDKVLGLMLDAEAQPAVPDTLTSEQQALFDERLAARAAKDYAKSDELRQKLAAAGIAVKDGKEGTVWERI